MIEACVRPELAENADLAATVGVDVLLGFSEGVQVSSKALVAVRFRHWGRMLPIAYIKPVLGQPSNLVFHR